MGHALIIGDNMVVSRAIESRLVPHGFDSFDRAWTKRQAIEAANQRRPDLIVVGDAIAEGSASEVARQVAEPSKAPIFIVTSGRVNFDCELSAGTQSSGPFHIVQLDTALGLLNANARGTTLCA